MSVERACPHREYVFMCRPYRSSHGKSSYEIVKFAFDESASNIDDLDWLPPVQLLGVKWRIIECRVAIKFTDRLFRAVLCSLWLAFCLWILCVVWRHMRILPPTGLIRVYSAIAVRKYAFILNENLLFFKCVNLIDASLEVQKFICREVHWRLAQSVKTYVVESSVQSTCVSAPAIVSAWMWIAQA